MNIDPAIIWLSRFYGITLIILVIVSFSVSIYLILKSHSKFSKFASIGFGLLFLDLLYKLIRHYFILDLIKNNNYLLVSGLMEFLSGIIVLVAIIFLALSQWENIKQK